MEKITQKTVDIDKILADKMGSKSKYVPAFLVSWLKHILHQDQVNEYLWDSRHLTGVDWLEECVRYLDMTLEVEGKENLPDKDDGKLYTFVSNHPLGGIDGVALGAVIGRHYDGKFRYLVNDILMNLPGLAPVCIPINKTGSQSRNFPAMVEAGFSSDNHMLMFPAGLCSRRINGEIKDLEWKKTFVTKAIDSQRDIVPMYFSGRNSGFFYRLANFRKWLGIKFNIETLYLPDEMFKNKGKTFDLYIGEPIPFEQLNDGTHHKEWCRKIREKCYNLPK